MESALWKNIALVAAGGALGSVARFLVARAFEHCECGSFPWATFVVNVLGCLLIGLFSALSSRGGFFSDDLRLLLTVGLCGGFTTFSTFMNENSALLRDGQWLMMGLYVAASVLLGFLAVGIGLRIGEHL